RLPLEPTQLPRLQLRAAPAEAVLSRQEHIDHAQLHSYVLEDGQVLHHFSCRTANWESKDLTIVLPGSGVKIVAAKVAGLWQDNLPVKEVDNGVEIRLPVPRGAEERTDGHSLQEQLLQNQAVNIDVYYSGEGPWLQRSSWARFTAAWPIL